MPACAARGFAHALFGDESMSAQLTAGANRPQIVAVATIEPPPARLRARWTGVSRGIPSAGKRAGMSIGTHSHCTRCWRRGRARGESSCPAIAARWGQARGSRDAGRIDVAHVDQRRASLRAQRDVNRLPRHHPGADQMSAMSASITRMARAPLHLRAHAESLVGRAKARSSIRDHGDHRATTQADGGPARTWGSLGTIAAPLRWRACWRPQQRRRRGAREIEPRSGARAGGTRATRGAATMAHTMLKARWGCSIAGERERAGDGDQREADSGGPRACDRRRNAWQRQGRRIPARDDRGRALEPSGSGDIALGRRPDGDARHRYRRRARADHLLRRGDRVEAGKAIVASSSVEGVRGKK